MRQFLKHLLDSDSNKIRNICWYVLIDSNGHPVIDLCGIYEPDPRSIPDQIEDIVFYWYAQIHEFTIMKNYYVDADGVRKSRAVPLPKNESD